MTHNHALPTLKNQNSILLSNHCNFYIPNHSDQDQMWFWWRHLSDVNPDSHSTLPHKMCTLACTKSHSKTNMVFICSNWGCHKKLNYNLVTICVSHICHKIHSFRNGFPTPINVSHLKKGFLKPKFIQVAIYRITKLLVEHIFNKII